MPVYVAGLERGVLPIGDWSIFISLAIFSSPVIVSYLPGFILSLFNSLTIALYNISLTNVLFPLPDTPVTQVNTHQ